MQRPAVPWRQRTESSFEGGRGSREERPRAREGGRAGGDERTTAPHTRSIVMPFFNSRNGQTTRDLLIRAGPSLRPGRCLPRDDVLQRLANAGILGPGQPRDGRAAEVVVRLGLGDRDELIDRGVVTDLHEL